MPGTGPIRVQWAVDLLEVRPGNRILEVGCGAGVAAALIAQRLGDGRITAIDRSPGAIGRASRRAADAVTAGRARFECLDLAGAGRLGETFDKIFAVNVNLFWTRDPTPELTVLRGLLRPGGGLHLIYETPPGVPADRPARTVAAALTAGGFTTTTTDRSESLVCVSGTLKCGRPSPPGSAVG